MCACRCGINVHIRKDENGVDKVRYIEGNRDHPINKGVLCAMGSAGIMQHYSPARLRKPLLRTGANYLTRGMVHVIGRKHARHLRLISLVIGGFTFGKKTGELAIKLHR